MFEMEKHVKPAVIMGRIIFDNDIVNELIEEVECGPNNLPFIYFEKWH